MKLHATLIHIPLAHILIQILLHRLTAETLKKTVFLQHILAYRGTERKRKREKERQKERENKGARRGEEIVWNI